MVCSGHFKAKYVRFLIKYHLLIFFCTLMMTSAGLSFLIYRRDRIDYSDFLRGFLAYGTAPSDDYRKFVALLRETQTNHLYPPTDSSKIIHPVPYPSFHAHSDPCSKRLYLSTCPILPYTELLFESTKLSAQLFDDVDTLKSICKLEWNLRSLYSNCSANSSCCHLIGPVGLVSDGEIRSPDQCDDITNDQWHDYQEQWSECHSSCSNTKLQTYLTHLNSSKSRFKIFISIENDRKRLVHLYTNMHDYQYETQVALVSIKWNSIDEEILLRYFLWENIHLIALSLGLYFLCLFLFVKNLFFILIILVHIVFTFVSCLIIYIHVLHLPLTVLNWTSVTLYLFILLIDSFLWHACWFLNNHRRDDCPIQRIIENLLTQTFFYLMPKNLTAIIALVITYTTQIIALQCFTAFSLLLIAVSFCISFTLYPASFIFILRYQSSIPSIEHLSHRVLTSTTSCFIDRTIPYLIVRLKALWLTLLTIVACLSFAIVFHWPKLQFDACQLRFDALPNRFPSHAVQQPTRSIDLDVTYYMGPTWLVPTYPLIPLNDIPILDYNAELKMTFVPDSPHTFAYALKHNWARLTEFCASTKVPVDERRPVHFRHYHRHVSADMVSEQQPTARTPPSPHQRDNLILNSFHCFSDLSPPSEDASASINSKFPSIIPAQRNKTEHCLSVCSSNTNQSECMSCLNIIYYQSHSTDDLFLLKNGLRFTNGANDPRYLLQTINYKWSLKTDLHQIHEWDQLIESLQTNGVHEFYQTTFKNVSFWWSSELFSTYTLMKQLHQEKHFLIAIKFCIIFAFLTLFTGALGVFVTLTTLFNFVTCIATLTLLNYKITVENMSYFVIVLIISSQYSVLYSISYKLAPTFFFQRENRTVYSLKQLCTTLLHLTFAIVVICTPCFFSSLPYLAKSAMVFTVSSLISLVYSTLFLQSLLCYIGPAGHSCCFIPWRLTCTRHLTFHINHSSSSNNNDSSVRSTSNSSGGTRRHHRHMSHPRMSTSSHFASSYFSQIFTGSTYFESEYGGLNDTIAMSSRRRESSRSHQVSHAIKRASLLTGELIELYTPRASLAPHSHHLHSRRYSRQSSLARGLAPMAPGRPLYISPSISPYSQLSIHSQVPPRQRSPSPHVYRPSRSPSPGSYAPPATTTATNTRSLRPCYSAPRLHAPLHRILNSTNPLTSIRPSDILFEETSTPVVPSAKKTVTIMQRQDAIYSSDEAEPCLRPGTTSRLTAATRRSMLKATTIESGGPVWLKRSNSS